MEVLLSVNVLLGIYVVAARAATKLFLTTTVNKVFRMTSEENLLSPRTHKWKVSHLHPIKLNLPLGGPISMKNLKAGKWNYRDLSCNLIVMRRISLSMIRMALTLRVTIKDLLAIVRIRLQMT